MSFLLFPFQSIFLALAQLRANKARSALTALGIIIGVASVTSVIAAMNGMRGFVLDEFAKVGTKYVFIDGREPSGSHGRFKWRDVQLTLSETKAIEENASTIEYVTPIWRSNFDVTYSAVTVRNVSVRGVWSTWHKIKSRTVVRGRELTRLDNEHARHVCLINEQAIEELGLNADPVGDYLLVGGRRFIIIGVLETISVSPMFGGGDPHTELFIPFETCRKMSPNLWIRNVECLLRSADEAEEAKAEISFILRHMRGLKPEEENTFVIEVVQTYIDGFKRLSRGLTAIAGGVVSISLLVGGVGIMNIMLVSVTERTHEIGLRKAVGARPAVILLQFLIEAIVLCLAGGVVGVVVGQALTLALSHTPSAHMQDASIPPWAIVLSLSFSIGVGVIFGMFPAVKASRLNPIDALRHE